MLQKKGRHYFYIYRRKEGIFINMWTLEQPGYVKEGRKGDEMSVLVLQRKGSHFFSVTGERKEF